MAITTYDELQTAVANWLDRGDLTARIPEFIALAEADINSQFDIRTIESDQTLTATQDSRYIALPAGFREAQQLWMVWNYSSARQALRFVTPETITVSPVSSVPVAWCVDGSNIAFDCPVNSTSLYYFVLRMMGGVALSDSAPTNLILTNYPNVYLFGALREAAPYLRDPDAVAYWEGRYRDALQLAKDKEHRAKALVTLSTEPGMLSYAARRGYNIYRGF